MAPGRTSERLALLVGSNPLPNFLAVRVLKPDQVVLLYSPQTEAPMERLKKLLEKEGKKIKSVPINDATCAKDIYETSKDLKGDHLNYTGGTKTMAAHARMAFRDAGWKDEYASYLDERKGVLRFDDGYEMDLSGQQIQLTLDDILALHGIDRLGSDGRSQDSPTAEDALVIAKAVLRDPTLAGKLYRIHRDENKKCRSFGKARENPERLDNTISGLSVKQITESDWDKRTFKKWLDFLRGGWLEIWCRALVRDIAKGYVKGDDKMAVGLDCRLATGRQCEIDVALVRGHRLYVISCTTDTTIKRCKSKLFEVALRARQLGGDLARSALVCLLHDSGSEGAYVDQLRNDVADVWDAPNTPRVFGLDDLKEWAGLNFYPNPSFLQQWLDT